MKTLAEYLHIRTGNNPAHRALTAFEAKVIGLPWPLKSNWELRYRKVLIEDKKFNLLMAKLSESRKSSMASPSVYKPPKPSKKRRSSPVVAKDTFLDSYEWKKVRMQALKMYGAKCMACGATPASGAVMNVDHIKPRKIFPALALDIKNLQILCHDCNHGKGNWDMTDWRTPEQAALTN